MQTDHNEFTDLIRNPILIEFLKAQLGLTSYETCAFISVLTGNTQATLVAENTGIPRSKVYGALDSLEQKGYIVKTDKGGYQPKAASVTSLKEQSNALTKNYLHFIERLYSFAIGQTRQIARLKEDIGDILQRNGFKVHFPRRTLGKDEERYLFREVDTMPIRFFYDKHIRSRKALDIIDAVPSEIRRKLLSTAQGFIDLIGESTTSGIRVGVVILTDVKRIDPPMLIETLLDTTCSIWNCQSSILVLPPEVPPSYSQELVRIHSEMRRTLPNNTKIVSLQGNYEEEISVHLKNIDMHWRELKDRLFETEEIKEKTKERIRNSIVRIDELVREIGSIPEEYRDVYQDIFSRTRRDLQNYESLTLSLEERIISWFRMLENKNLFALETLLESRKALKEIELAVTEKRNELTSFEEEIYSLNTGANPYKKYGFLVNPFSLTVPMLKPDAIINEAEQKKSTETFIKDLLDGSDSNLLFVIAKEGGGKSHFLNFYCGKINEQKYGKAIAIRIQCRPNRDLLDLYPQITTEIAKVAKEKSDEKLSATITEALTEAGTPRVISDLMKILGSIALRISNSGHGSLFIMIDEFENALPTVVYERRHVLPFEGGRIGTPQAISQLDSLTQLSGIGFVVVFRKEVWEQWKGSIESKVNKYEKSLAIKLEDLNLKDTISLIVHRLESPQFRKQDVGTKSPKFKEELIKTIWARAQGNPRRILRLANRAFRRAVTKGTAEVATEHLEF